MGICVRLWCEDERLGEQVRGVLAPDMEVSAGPPDPSAPDGAAAHIIVESADGTGTVFVVPEAAASRGLRSVLLAEEGDPGGLVTTGNVTDRLLPTVQAVVAGQVAVPAELLATARRPLLTNREKQVLALVVMGLGNREIGGRLHLSESTVKSHLFSSYRKLGVNSRGEATRLILDRETGVGLGILEISDSARN